MSAFLCSDQHINTIVSFGVLNEASYYRDNRHHYLKQERDASAQILKNTNIDAINARYREGCQHESIFFRQAGARDLEPVAVLKLCNSYDYQACEVPDYENTEAAKIVDSVRHVAIRKLPGYDDLPWAI